jgi:hypothetical protein
MQEDPVSISIVHYSKLSDPLRDALQSIYDFFPSRKKLPDGKCVGVLSATMKSTSEVYSTVNILAISGHGVDIEGNEAKNSMNNTDLNNWKCACQTDFILAPLTFDRSIYNEVKDAHDAPKGAMIDYWVMRISTRAKCIQTRLKKSGILDDDRKKQLVFDMLQPLGLVDFDKFSDIYVSFYLNASEGDISELVSILNASRGEKLFHVDGAVFQYVKQLENCEAVLTRLLQERDEFSGGMIADEWGTSLSSFLYKQGLPREALGVVQSFVKREVDISSKIADAVAQCAEDNATLALVDHLNHLEEKPVSVSIEWCATQRLSGEIEQKDLCFVCKERFQERLKELVTRAIQPGQQN